MNKTLLGKLTERHYYDQSLTVSNHGDEFMLNGVMHEMILLREDAKNLMQPRPEAVANLLRMVRKM